jgi:4,5-dihydroxyphthalate decarboxylase
MWAARDAYLAQAHAYAKPIVALPVVVMRGFHHAALVCRQDAPIRDPADLVGKRVGVRAFSQTTGIWVRGILLDEYGVDHRDITWMTQEDAHVQEYLDPPNVARIRPDQNLSAMLMAGEIDAGIALGELDPALIRPVIPNADEDAAVWFRKTGAYPVNHVVCLRTALRDANPWLPAELFRQFTEAKAAACEPPAEVRYAETIGGDPLPYGLEANRRGIELCLRYAAEQGLVGRVYAPEDMFTSV